MLNGIEEMEMDNPGMGGVARNKANQDLMSAVEQFTTAEREVSW